jgi:hypothetical protein
MNSIETFSKYLNDLAKEKKYQNVLVNFKNNASDFSKQDIRSNNYIIKNILDAHRHEKSFDEAHKFISEYEIEISSSQHRIVVSSYIWLLCFELEEKISKENSIGCKETLDQINNILPTLDFNSDYYDVLFLFTLKKASALKKISPLLAVEQIVRLLKSVKIKNNNRLKDAIKNDSYACSAIASSFGKAGYVDRGFRFLKYIDVNPFEEGTGEELLNSYGWLLYYKLKEQNNNINDEQPDEDIDTMFVDFQIEDGQNNPVIVENVLSKEQIDQDTIKILAALKKDNKFSPFSRLFNLYLKIEKAKPNTNWTKVCDLLEAIDKEKLSLNCRTVTFSKFGKDKIAELASDKEVWYSLYCTALFQLKRFDDCLQFSKEAFETIPKFHYNNDIWFSRKISLCERELGNFEIAIQGLEAIVRKKPEWFIQREIAELYFEKGDIIASKKLAVLAALNRDEREKKDGLFLLMGKIFLKEGDKVNSFKHFKLAFLIREELQYKIPQALKDLLNETKPEGETVVFEEVEKGFKELQKLWKSINPNQNDLNSIRQSSHQKGKVVKIIESKRIGFVLGDNGEEYFFHFNDFRGSKPQTNIIVKFKAKKPDSPEKKWIAFDILPQN